MFICILVIYIIAYYAFQIVANPKILQSMALIAFELWCAYFAAHYTITQTTRYLENSDASSIDTKLFNESPEDPYPALTACILGSELRWYNVSSIFEGFEVTTSKYGEILKGKEVIKYEYDYQTRLYETIPVDIRNGSHEDFETFSLSISDLITGLEYVTKDDKTSIHYGKGSKGKETINAPFYVSYATPDTICFTRKDNDSSNDIRTHDWLLLNRSIFGNDLYRNVHFNLYFHHPGQLLRTFHNPFFASNILLGTKNNEEKAWDKVLKIMIEEVTVLRKREGSNIPCNNNLNKFDDVNFMDTIMQRVGCVPIYWKRFTRLSNLGECETPNKLEEIYQHIQNYEDDLFSYHGPCIDMVVEARFDKEEENQWEEPQIKVVYTKATYQNIENTQSFGFESFLSGVGGFIGIFLGYSILQVPELLGSVLARLRNIKLMGSDANAVKPNKIKKRKRGQQKKVGQLQLLKTQFRKLLKKQVETQSKKLTKLENQVAETQNQFVETQKQVVQTQNQVEEIQSSKK